MNSLAFKDKPLSNIISLKNHSGRVIETKEEVRNGVTVGIVQGYIATWDLDRGGWDGVKDRFTPGAFLESIQEHKNRDNRQVRMMSGHRVIIGGFPIDTVREDATGLFGRGEVNLDSAEGKAIFSLAKQGVIVDFSIGFIVIDSSESVEDEETIRTITKATLIEGSLVGEPMNPAARVTGVKAFDIDAADKFLSENCNIDDATKALVLESLLKMSEDSGELAITLPEVQKIESLKDVDAVLKKCGLSNNAADALISKIKEFKSSDQGDLGNGTDDSDQGDPEDESAVVTILESLALKCDERAVVQKINQLHDKVNPHVAGSN